MIKFGKTGIENNAEEVQKSREIVQVILDYGITQQQLLRIAYLLCLELENRETMIDISDCIKKYLDEISSGNNNNIIT
tara:strand:- start:11 stop:244 length:234 start_codon:yes stop_codon:yes gene_type:complete